MSDGFSKVVGRHTLKFGGEFRYLQVNERNLASQDGAFVFDGTVTGVDFADYLLGAPRAPEVGTLRQRYNSWIRARAMAVRMCKTMEGNPQPDAEPRSALGSEHALV